MEQTTRETYREVRSLLEQAENRLREAEQQARAAGAADEARELEHDAESVVLQLENLACDLDFGDDDPLCDA